MQKKDLKNHLRNVTDYVVYMERKQILLLYISVFLLFSMMFFHFSLFPSWLNLKDKKEILGNISMQNRISEAKVKKLKKLKIKENQCNNYFSEHKNFFIGKDEVQKLISTIAETGNLCGVDFLEFTPLPRKKNQLFTEIPVSVSVKGGFTEVFRFMENVSKSEMLITLDSVNIKSTDDTGKLSVVCFLKGYGSDDF